MSFSKHRSDIVWHRKLPEAFWFAPFLHSLSDELKIFPDSVMSALSICDSCLERTKLNRPRDILRNCY